MRNAQTLANYISDRRKELNIDKSALGYIQKNIRDGKKVKL
ncbi:hypothetical protein [Methanocella paludicola]|nr:hypothetical protein [Methanocella paludicola]